MVILKEYMPESQKHIFKDSTFETWGSSLKVIYMKKWWRNCSEIVIAPGFKSVKCIGNGAGKK